MAKRMRPDIARPEVLGTAITILALFFGGVGGGFRVSSGDELAQTAVGPVAPIRLWMDEGTGRASTRHTTIGNTRKKVARSVLEEAEKLMIAEPSDQARREGRPPPASR